MESPRILVTGLPDSTTERQLTIYFQSQRDSGGGDVKRIDIDINRGEAVITFEDVEAATRVVRRRNHSLQNCPLQVALLPDSDGSMSDDGDEAFQDCVADAEEDQSKGNREFEYLQMGHKRRQHGEEYASPQPSDTTVTKRRRSSSSPSLQSTVKVSGLRTDVSKDLLLHYFENHYRSKGGPVTQVQMKPVLQICLVTFESPDDAKRVAEHSPHILDGSCLEVSLIEDRVAEGDLMDVDREMNNLDEGSGANAAGITIMASGILPSSTDDAIRNYFENSRRSGGGEICDFNFYAEEGIAVITFSEVEDLEKLLHSSHSIGGRAISVLKQQPNKAREKTDPLRVHVRGLDKNTTEDDLLFYLEHFSLNAEVREVNLGDDNDAIATFSHEPDFTTLFDGVHRDVIGLNGSKLRLEHVPICTCVVVKGLNASTKEESIKMYFENTRRSGGNVVSHVKRKTKDSAVVFFEDPTSAEGVIKQASHTLEQKRLEVKAYYPLFECRATNQTKILIDSDIFDHIKLHNDRDLQTLLEQHKVELYNDPVNDVVTLSPSDERQIPQQSWKTRAWSIENFLRCFTKIEIPIAPERFDEISARWKNQHSTQGSSTNRVYFLRQEHLVQIIGKSDTVIEERRKLQTLMIAAEEDTELMKSIGNVVEPGIPKNKLRLFKESGLREILQSQYQQLMISIDLDNETLSLDGPRSILKEVQAEVFRFISKMIERTVELPTNLINVLKVPRVSSFTQDLLKQRSIQAIFIYDQSRGFNEVHVLGIDLQSAKEAEKVLLDSVLERSISLTAENTQVLDSHPWKEFRANANSTFKAEIVVEVSTNTVWVSGISEDVKKCFDETIQFLEVNTIVYDTLTLDPGSTRFVFERWGSKLEEIKKDLIKCSVDIRMAADLKGIDVSGTKEGLAECLPRLVSLTQAILRESIPVDKPGMRKFFSKGKGPKLLKTVEDDNSCTIIMSERNENDVSVAATESTEEGMSSEEFICSYLTNQGKKISVFRGDLTKHRVDAIVNAANEELKHVGGLAAAIVEQGGADIQVQCDQYIQKHGLLLEGRTTVTQAGVLPCDSIIHTVGPKWDSQADIFRQNGTETRQEKVLKLAIKNCLNEAASVRSIAIPAVSSGVYGFPRELCAKIIVDVILDFCEANPSSRLSDIHLVNNDSETVKVFAEELRNRFAGKQQFEDSQNLVVPNPGPYIQGGGDRRPKPEASRSLTTPEGVRITVEFGDLAKQQAHVLVGSAAQDLRLSNNPCAKALRIKAGEGFERECTSKGPVAVGDIAVLDQTGKLNCQAVIFAVCSDWDNGKGKKTLRGLLHKCLKEADSRRVSSVAFAAIGTGILHFPRDQVADIYFDQVMSYSQKNLATTVKDVRFVLHDTATFQSFDDEFKKRSKPIPQSVQGKRSSHGKHPQTTTAALSHGSVSFSPVIERKPDHLEATIGPICFKVQPGDITEASTEAIAVITNSQLDLSVSRGAGGSILKKGGDSISTECSRYPEQNPGSIVVTKAGHLKPRALFHIVPIQPFNTRSMKVCLDKCLQEAESRRMSSISLPAIGTGILDMTAKSCARTMMSMIREFASQHPIHVKLIQVTVFKQEMVKDFRSVMYEFSGIKPPTEPGIVQRFTTGVKTMIGYIGFGGSAQSRTSSKSGMGRDEGELDLTIVAGCESDLRQAIQAVYDVMTDNCKKRVIINETVKNLTEEYLQTIHTLELIYEVKITVEKEVDRVEICGQPDDILHVMGEIHEMLHQIKSEENERTRAEELSKDVQWKFKIGDRFEDYDSQLNTEIEVAYSQRKRTVKIDQGKDKYTLNFDNMTEKDEMGNITDIKRIDHRKGIQVPDYWDPQPQDQNDKESTVHPVVLNNLSPEYRKVSDMVKQTQSVSIVKIERIQNPTLYGLYAIQKQKMDLANGSKLNEELLFHGTAGSNCNAINHGGFDRSYSWQRNTLYGKGVYFAKDASYSARSTYSPPDRNGLRHMYLARVLVGDYTVGRPDLLAAPKKTSADPTDTYDSVVDQIPNPTIFVVFRDYRSYPEYLITFK